MALYLGINFPGARNLQEVLQKFQDDIKYYAEARDVNGTKVDPWDNSAVSVGFGGDKEISLSKNGVFYSERYPELKSNYLEYADRCMHLVSYAESLGGIPTGCEGDPIQIGCIAHEVERWFGKKPAPDEIDWIWNIQRLLALNSDEEWSMSFFSKQEKWKPLIFENIIDLFIWNNLSVGQIDYDHKTLECWDGSRMYSVKWSRLMIANFESTLQIKHESLSSIIDEQSQMPSILNDLLRASLWVQIFYDSIERRITTRSHVPVTGNLPDFSRLLLIFMRDMDHVVTQISLLRQKDVSP